MTRLIECVGGPLDGRLLPTEYLEGDGDARHYYERVDTESNKLLAIYATDHHGVLRHFGTARVVGKVAS